MSDHKCSRCGAPLKVETVQVPVYVDLTYIGQDKPARSDIIARYEEREEVSDCVRCTGSY